MSAVSAQLVKEQDPVLGQRVHSRAGVITPKGKTPMQTFWLFTDDDTKKVQTRVSRTIKRNSDGALALLDIDGNGRVRPRTHSFDGILSRSDDVV